MADVAAEFLRAERAFDKPTLSLLQRKSAPVAHAVFALVFADTDTVLCDLLHEQTNAYLNVLRQAGHDVPDMDGKTLCSEWMRKQFLYRSFVSETDNREVYSLTAAALEAQQVVASLNTERALISDSRIATITETARRVALLANPDVDQQIAHLNGEIARLTAERDRLVGGGDVVVGTDDQLRDGAADLLDMLIQVPSDFARVVEAIREMPQTNADKFRADGSAGGVLDIYFDTQELLRETPQGRAYHGALALLLDVDRFADLQADLRAILGHPFADTLKPAEKRNLKNAMNVLRRGISAVNDEQRRTDTALARLVKSRDGDQDRELDRLLRRAESLLARYMQNAGPRSWIETPLLPGKTDSETLPLLFASPDSFMVPPAAAIHDNAEPEDIRSVADLRSNGGPQLAVLRAAALDRLAMAPDVTLSEIFNDLDNELRRPVEILGLLQLWSTAHPYASYRDRDSVQAVYEARRPDGSTRRLLAPDLRFSPHGVNELQAQQQ